MKAHKKFKSQLYVLTKDEGGRYTPFQANYRPQMFIRTSDVTAALSFPEGTDPDKMVMPGDNVETIVTLTHDIALDSGARFTLREGGKTVATGVVTEILE